MNENSSCYYESGCKFVFNAKGYEVVAANSLLGKVVISINGDTVFKGRVKLDEICTVEGLQGYLC